MADYDYLIKFLALGDSGVGKTSFLVYKSARGGFGGRGQRVLLQLWDWLSQLKIHAYCEAPDIILCGNKSDLENRRQVSTARAKQLADQLGLPYFETSACTSSNVEKAVDCLLDLVMQRIQMSVGSDNLPAGCIGSGNRLNVEEDFSANKTSYYCNNC
uniref:Ras family protein n=1 Tax=Meloidogyne hapla TaxID=6305 RepID=A0A1I8BPV7_MELHA